LAEWYVEDTLLIMASRDAVIGTHIPGQEPGKLGQIRLKLLKFLENSNFYNIATLLKKLSESNNNLFTERVILHKKLGQHENALKILVYKLKDNNAAEKYCAQFPDGSDDKKQAFLQLLKVYFFPEDSKSAPSIDDAIHLMELYAKHLDPMKVIEMLPQTITLSKLNTFLVKSIHNVLHTRRDSQVLKNINKINNLETKYSLVQVQSKNVRITTERMCPKCHKRIGDKIFAVYPSGEVVHFSCMQSSQPKVSDATPKSK